MWNRKEMKAKALAAVKANYWKSVVVAFIYAVVTTVEAKTSGIDREDIESTLNDAINSAANPVLFISLAIGAISALIIVAIVINIFIQNPLVVGCQRFFLKNLDDKDTKVDEVVGPFKEGNYFNILLAKLISDFFCALGIVCFLVPGIILYCAYILVPYILADEPDLSWREVLKKSREMMRGHKWQLFILALSFIGWDILSALTWGLLDVFLVRPYKYSTYAEVYKTLKGNQQPEVVEAEEVSEA